MYVYISGLENLLLDIMLIKFRLNIMWKLSSSLLRVKDRKIFEGGICVPLEIK